MNKTRVFDHIAIIYNPISTGDAPRMAQELAASIKMHRDEIGIKPTLTPTKHARHAQELAEKIALKYKRPLIVSVSGDGGYNEVVNGALAAKAQNKKAAPVVAVSGAGNANDHRRVMRDKPLIDLIREAQPKPMDLIHISAKGPQHTFARYAHSYIGFGISPQVAVELNRHSLNRYKETVIAIKAFVGFKPFSVTYQGKTRLLDSLIFANINEMAKILKFKDKLDVTDNRFEVVEFPHENKFRLLYRLLKAAIVGLTHQPQYERYVFKTDSKYAQLDGEVDELPGDATVTIRSIPKAIETLYT